MYLTNSVNLSPNGRGKHDLDEMRKQMILVYLHVVFIEP